LFKTPTAKRVAIVTGRYLIIIVAALLIAKALLLSIDQYGTREITLVRVNGSTFCQSCMGLYK
jgi:hypothetical protein